MKNNRGQKGILTFDFMFSFLIIIGLFQFYFHITFTLLAAQATQYVMFSSARAFFAGNHSVQDQNTLAEAKFKKLTEESPLAIFFNSKVKLSNFEAREFEEIPVSASGRQKFVGTSVLFDAKMLNFKVPLMGSTASSLEGEGFTANISAYLYREPTSFECLGFNKARGAAIKNLNSGKYSKSTQYGFKDETAVFSDNGC